MKSPPIFKKNIKPQKGAPLFIVELDREEDGRWIAEIPAMPGAMAYGDTKRDALHRAYSIALRALADAVEQGSVPKPVLRIFEYGMARH